MKTFRDFEIVGGAERARAEFVETEPRDAGGLPLNAEFAAANVQQDCMRRSARSQTLPGVLHRFVGSGSERRIIDRRGHQLAQAEILRAGDLQHIELLLQQRDERKEELAVDAVLVEFVGWPVRGRDNHHIVFKQALEQPAQNHRIGNVGDLNFVEAQQLRLRRHGLRRIRDQTILASATLTRLAQERVLREHEFVKVHAALLLHRRRLEE